jgi:hypothetical protein
MQVWGNLSNYPTCRGGLATKCKIGWSGCTKMGSESDCAFAQCRCRTPSLVHTPERKRNSRNMHPGVISQTNNINEGNKRNLAESKTDLVGMQQKKQRDFGRYEAMKYFMQDDVKRLSWSAPIFNDGKVDSKDGAIADSGIFVSSSKCLCCDVRMFSVCKVS